jgi:hypothetical protein
MNIVETLEIYPIYRLPQSLVVLVVAVCWFEGITRLIRGKKKMPESDKHFGALLLRTELFASIVFMILSGIFFHFVTDVEILRSAFFEYHWVGWAVLGVLSLFPYGLEYMRRIDGTTKAFLTTFFFPLLPLFVTWLSWIVGSTFLLLPNGGR